jgi:hypothetical protein
MLSDLVNTLKSSGYFERPFLYYDFINLLAGDSCISISKMKVLPNPNLLLTVKLLLNCNRIF